MNTNILREVGLTENETKVYSALLRLGPSSVNKLYEETGIYRRNIYDVLNKLIEKGLATNIIEKKKKIYSPKSPQRIITYLQEQKKLIEEKERLVQKELPELIRKFAARRSHIEAELYRGKEAIKTLIDDTLNYKEVLFIGAGGFITDKLPFYWKVYNKKRIKLGIKWRALAIDEMRQKPIVRENLFEFRFLPKHLSGPPNVIWIYGENVANVLWLDIPIAFVLNKREIANSYKKYFRFLWDNIAKD